MATQVQFEPDITSQPTPEVDREYLVVSDKDSQVIYSGTIYQEARSLANKIRKCGGECTIFGALKG